MELNLPVSFPLIALTVISLVLLAILSALEKAFEGYSKLRYEVDKKQEKNYALVMEQLLETEGELMLSIRAANNVLLVIFGVSCALLFSAFYVGLAVAVSLVLLVSKLLPYTIASAHPEFVLEYFIYIAKGVYKIFSPFTGKVPEPVHLPDKEESNEITIFQNALNFSDVIVKECMIPRTEICAVPRDATNKQLLEQFAESRYSRIIIYNESIDKIIGYVHSKDLFVGDKPISEIIRKIDYVQEDMEAQELLALLIKNKRSIAVVNDEYGGTAGIVTLEDLIEEIFGEISDELDKEELPEKKISDNEYIFSGRLEIKYLNKTYDLDIPESDFYETLGGFITWFHENIPAEGELLKYDNFEFSILKTGSNRVESVVLRIVEE
ncbi:MAG: hemolysin family protein [Bacteroidales bacterium]|nr:hemolysin family protein [Bacteroidales bacterium]MDD3300174.1 hemolysin family protein [Bacteroidales bacterium]